MQDRGKNKFVVINEKVVLLKSKIVLFLILAVLILTACSCTFINISTDVVTESPASNEMPVQLDIYIYNLLLIYLKQHLLMIEVF